jgi:hypothetical protein
LKACRSKNERVEVKAVSDTDRLMDILNFERKIANILVLEKIHAETELLKQKMQDTCCI